MSIRETVARWLAPDTFDKAARYDYLRCALSDAQMWLGYEFPEVDEAIKWAKVSEVNYFRSLDESSIAAVTDKPWIWTISDFREHLRAKRKALHPSTTSPPGQGTLPETGQDRDGLNEEGMPIRFSPMTTKD